MVKIKKAYNNYIKKIYLGKRAYFIEIDEHGYDDKNESMAIAAASFPIVYIYGDNVFKQNKDIVELCKNINKNNPMTEIIIETDGMVRPIGMNSIKNVKYFVFVKPIDNDDESMDNRMNENAWKWLGKAGAHFIYPIENIDDLDTINTIISGLMIKKKQVYVKIKNDDDFSKIVFNTKTFGFNIYVEFNGDWIDQE